MLTLAIAHGDCADKAKESLHWKLTLGEKSLVTPGHEPASVLHLAFQSDTLPTELSLPMVLAVTGI